MAHWTKIHWSALEKHHNDLQAVSKKLGFLDDRGRIRKFDSKTFWPAMAELGHDSGEVESCKCNTQVFRTE